MRLIKSEHRDVSENPEIEIAELKQWIADIRNLLEKDMPPEEKRNLVSGGARDRLEPALTEYERRLAELTREEELPRSA